MLLGVFSPESSIFSFFPHHHHCTVKRWSPYNTVSAHDFFFWLHSSNFFLSLFIYFFFWFAVTCWSFPFSLHLYFLHVVCHPPLLANHSFFFSFFIALIFFFFSTFLFYPFFFSFYIPFSLPILSTCYQFYRFHNS